MDILCLPATARYSNTPPPYSAVKQHLSFATTSSSFVLASEISQNCPVKTSTGLRRPITHSPTQTSSTGNPLKKLITSQNTPNSPSPYQLSNKLRLSSKLSPPPPHIPVLSLEETLQAELEDDVLANSEENGKEMEFREKGKIFVGNLPLWIKKIEVAEFFRQFGPIKNVILVKGHDDVERNMGFGFVLYDGLMAEKAATKAVEFDGVEFHGRVLTVKLDNGRRTKSKMAERVRWVEGRDEDGNGFRSKWHKERDGSRREFQRVLETQPENWQAVVRTFESIKKPARKEYGLMVNFYAKRGDMHRARETFEKMRARGIEPTLHVYTNLIHAYAVGRDMEEALSCVRKMKDEGIEMSLVTYSILVGGFGKIGNFEAAELWFKEAKEKLAGLNAIIYGNIIYACCQTCNMNRAEALVREMEEEGIDAPIGIYNTMMDGYTMIQDENKCLMVFDRLKQLTNQIVWGQAKTDFLIITIMFNGHLVAKNGIKVRELIPDCWININGRECGLTPSVISYGCLINLYTKVGKISKALEVSDMMKLAGIKHNMKTYSMLINGFMKLKDWANVFSIFEDVIGDGLKPDVILYNNIISAFCGMGNVERAIRTVEEMKRERHRPSTRTFMPIILTFARAGEMRKALEVFDLMRRSGCIPTVQTYNALILGLVKKRQMEKAVAILEEMLLASISPNEHTYTNIMDGYASLGDTGKAFEYFSKLKNEGLELDVYTYEALLRACCKAGRMQSALAVTKEMRVRNIPRNTFIYNILIDGWARRGDVWEAADLMQQMRQEGLQPDIHAFTSFINACCKAGDMLRAMKTLEEMEVLGVKANIKTYTTLIHGWSRAYLPEKALKCFEDMKGAGLTPDKAVYHCLMTSLLSRATVAEDYIYNGILGICEEMVNSGLTVDMGTAVHWSKCLHKMERSGGGITEALQKTFPPDWNSHKTLDAISGSSDEDCGSTLYESDTDGEDARFQF